MEEHLKLMRDARESLDQIFQDKTVPIATVKESLNSLREHIDRLLNMFEG